MFENLKNKPHDILLKNEKYYVILVQDKYFYIENDDVENTYEIEILAELTCNMKLSNEDIEKYESYFKDAIAQYYEETDDAFKYRWFKVKNMNIMKCLSDVEKFEMLLDNKNIMIEYFAKCETYEPIPYSKNIESLPNIPREKLKDIFELFMTLPNISGKMFLIYLIYGQMSESDQIKYEPFVRIKPRFPENTYEYEFISENTYDHGCMILATSQKDSILRYLKNNNVHNFNIELLLSNGMLSMPDIIDIFEYIKANSDIKTLDQMIGFISHRRIIPTKWPTVVKHSVEKIIYMVNNIENVKKLCFKNTDPDALKTWLLDIICGFTYTKTTVFCVDELKKLIFATINHIELSERDILSLIESYSKVWFLNSLTEDEADVLNDHLWKRKDCKNEPYLKRNIDKIGGHDMILDIENQGIRDSFIEAIKINNMVNIPRYITEERIMRLFSLINTKEPIITMVSNDGYDITMIGKSETLIEHNSIILNAINTLKILNKHNIKISKESILFHPGFLMASIASNIDHMIINTIFDDTYGINDMCVVKHLCENGQTLMVDVNKIVNEETKIYYNTEILRELV